MAARGAGARYRYTQTDGTWSRARALNAGFGLASGQVLVSTDADMLFSPRSMEIIAQRVLDDPWTSVVLQCRDLPTGYDASRISELGFDWSAFASSARLRPRWGMGGMMAVSRAAFDRVRGLDERMHTYGGEDMDFAKRIQRAGYRLIWIEDDSVRMYHMWHPSSRNVADGSVQGKAAVDFNRKIVDTDPTTLRNVLNWEYPGSAGPLVSVAIATYNRAEFLRTSINSVLLQTMQDFEIVVVDDGSTDQTRAVVASFNDPRIRYFYQENAGISAARNRAADESRGFYTAVHDDDDLMIPERLQISLSAMRQGVQATFGSWANFDDVTGEFFLHVSKKAFAPTTSFLTGQAPGHSTWLVETELIRSFRYNESITSAIDNNLALRMMRAGVRWVHTGKILFLRRVHAGQVTETDGSNQKVAAKLSRFMIHTPASVEGRKELHEAAKKEPWPKIAEKDNLDAALLRYLPDHLVNRQLEVRGDIEDFAIRLGKVRNVDYILTEMEVTGSIISHYAKFSDVSLDDLVQLRGLGLNVSVTATRKVEGQVRPLHPMLETSRAILQSIQRLLDATLPTSQGVSLLIPTGEEPFVLPVSVRGVAKSRLIHSVTDAQHQMKVVILTFSEIASGIDAYRKLSKLYPCQDLKLVTSQKDAYESLKDTLLPRVEATA